MKILVVVGVAACLLGHARVAAAYWILDTDVSAVYEDNVGLGKFRRDIKSDSALSALASGGPAIQLDDSTVISLTGDVAGKLYERFTGLDNVALGLTGTLRRKFGLGADAPWARIWGSIARQQYDNDLRDSWIVWVGGPASGSASGGTSVPITSTTDAWPIMTSPWHPGYPVTSSTCRATPSR